MTTATTTQPTLTLSNFRVEYRAPKYEDGLCLYDGYCAILADDAEFDGRSVRVFDVPDADEEQREVAQWACEAMNAHERLVEALRSVGLQLHALAGPDSGYIGGDLRSIRDGILRTIRATTTNRTGA